MNKKHIKKVLAGLLCLVLAMDVLILTAFAKPPSTKETTSTEETSTEATSTEDNSTEESSEAASTEGPIGIDPHDDETTENKEEQSTKEEILDDIPTPGSIVSLGNGGVLVTSYADLWEVLTGTNDYTHIYFGSNITVPSSNSERITIPASKNNVVISGRPPGTKVSYTLIQRNSSAIEDTLHVATANMNITIEDMVVEGYNYYGICGVAASGVTITHRNVAYTGPQIGYNRQGTLIFNDCDITLVSQGPGGVGEVAEANQVILEGTVNISRNTVAINDSTFWLTGSNAAIVVMPGANVTLNSNTYFVYNDSSPRATVFIADDASLIARCDMGFSYESAYPSSLYVGQNAIFNFSQTKNNYTMNLESELTVSKDATFIYDCGSADTNVAAVRMRSSGASVTFDDPKRVVILNNANAVISAVTGTSTMNVTVGSINQWTTKPSSIDTAVVPNKQWNKLGSTPLSFTASFSSYNVNSITNSNLDIDLDPVDEDLTKSTFSLGVYMLAIGQSSLTIDEVFNSDTTVSGSADTGPVYATYTGEDGEPATAAGTAEGGRYSIPLTTAPMTNSLFTADSFSDRLWSRQYTEVRTGGNLMFSHVPDVLKFATLKLSGKHHYGYREDPDWAIEVDDSRPRPNGFKVSLSAPEPFSATRSDGTTVTLPSDALVYVSGESRQVINNEPVKVYSTTQTTGGNHTISWSENQGPLLWLNSSTAYTNITYTTTLTWTLEDTP